MNRLPGKFLLILTLAFGLILAGCSAAPAVSSGDGIVRAVLFLDTRLQLLRKRAAQCPAAP